MPRKRSVTRKKKAPSKEDKNSIPDDDGGVDTEVGEQRDVHSSSEEKESITEENLKIGTSESNTIIEEDTTTMNDENNNTPPNQNLNLLDPHDHDLSSSDEGMEDEINHPTTPLIRRRTTTSTNNKNNNNRQQPSTNSSSGKDPTSPSSPSTLQSTTTSSEASSSSPNTTTIEKNLTENESNNSHHNTNSQDVLDVVVKKTRTPKRKPIQSKSSTKKPSPPSRTDEESSNDRENTLGEASCSNNESTTNTPQDDASDTIPSTNTTKTTDSSSSESSTHKMDDDDAFLTHKPEKDDDDSDEVICETPKKSRVTRRRTPAPTPKSTKAESKDVVAPANSEQTSSADEKEDKSEAMDTTDDINADNPKIRTPIRTPIRSRGKSVKRKTDTSSESDSDSESNKSQSKQRKLDSRPQRRRETTTPLSQRASSSSTPQPSPGLARPRKLDVSKKLLILRGADLKNLTNLKKKVTSAINEAKKNANKASPKRPDTDVSRLSGNLTDLDLKLLTDESISTGTVTLIDGTSQSNKRSFKDVEEYDEFKEFRDGTMIQIQIPNVRVFEEEPVGPVFKRTAEFIKYEDPDRYDRSTLTLNPVPPQGEFDIYSHRKIDISVEYNLESEDEEWLNIYNKQSKYPLSEKDFESTIALMNRASKNGRSCWFSVASVIELSRFFDIKLEEHHIVQVKRLWESKYNPEKKLFKDTELQKRIENENLLYSYMCVRQQLNSYKENVENVMEVCNQKKDLLDKQLKQMKRKNYSFPKDLPRFVTKYSAITYDGVVDFSSETTDNQSNKLEDNKDAFLTDQIEIDLFTKEEEKKYEERKKKVNQKVRKLWKHNKKEDEHDDPIPEMSGSNEIYPSPTTSSLASLIIPPLPPIVTKNLSNLHNTESKTPTTIDTPTSAISNLEDQHSSKRRTRKKRVDSGTPTSNVSRTPTSATNLDFQNSFELTAENSLSSPTPDIVPPLLEAISPLPSPNMRRKKKRSKIIIN